MGLSVVGSFEDFLAAQLTIEAVFRGALFRAQGQPEVIDDELGGRDAAFLFEEGWSNALVNSSGKADLLVIAEKADIFMVHVSGIFGGGRKGSMVGQGGLVPHAILEAENEIANSDAIAFSGGVGEQGSDSAVRGAVEKFVGVEREDPGRADFVEAKVAGLSEVVVPGNGEDTGAGGFGDADGAVRRAEIGRAHV